MRVLGEQNITHSQKGVWPGNNRDLSPIENLRVYLKSTIYEEPIPRDRASLIRRFQKNCNDISTTVLENLSQSFELRIEDVLAASGGSTKF